MSSFAGLAELRRDAEQTTDDVRELIASLSDEELVRPPDADSWSIAQCIEHLIRTGEGYHPCIEEALAQSEQGGEPYTPTLFGRLFLALGGPRVRLPLKAHRLFQPAKDTAADSPRRFVEQQAELIGLLFRAEGADLRTRVRAPHSRFLSLQLGETLTMLVRHQQRHLAQAQRVREAIRK